MASSARAACNFSRARALTNAAFSKTRLFDATEYLHRLRIHGRQRNVFDLITGQIHRDDVGIVAGRKRRFDVVGAVEYVRRFAGSGCLERVRQDFSRLLGYEICGHSTARRGRLSGLLSELCLCMLVLPGVLFPHPRLF